METESYVNQLRVEGSRLAEIASAGPLDASVKGCPGWNLRDLLLHVGGVHRWAMTAVQTGAQPDEGELAKLTPSDTGDLSEWLLNGVEELANTLSGIDPAAPTWHVFPIPQVAGVWPRRQMHETTVHRWDAELAVGDLTPIVPAVASDGIDEFFEVMLPRLLVRKPIALPRTTLHVHCTDTDGEWFVWNDNGQVGVRREHTKADGALRGPAESILLRLWGRDSPRFPELSTAGSNDAVEAWLDLESN